MQLENLWAKTEPFQSIVTHGVLSGNVAQYLLDQYVSEGLKQQLQDSLSINGDELRQYIGYLVSLHDIGKIEYSFQAKYPDFKKLLESDPLIKKELFQPNVRHEKSGQRCIRAIWKGQSEERYSALLFSKMIGVHHQGKTGPGIFHSDSEWFRFQQEFEDKMRRYFLSSNLRLPVYKQETQGPLGAILLGILILSDWISSSSIFQEAESWINTEQASKVTKATIEDFLEQSGLLPIVVDWGSSFCNIWKNIPENGRRLLQVKIEEVFQESKNRYDLVLIEAPMGEGKTEAGIYAALQMARQWKRDGLYIALPTAATANQMVNRARALLDMHNQERSVRLLHGMAWMEQTDHFQGASKDEADQIARWLAPMKRGLLGQYAVGTIDQAMLASTIVRHGELRLLGLANKVLIIDEIHSYDQYMMSIILRLLEWCKALEIPVVMLSATLPPEMKAQLFSPYTKRPLSDRYPLVTAVDEKGDLIERTIEHTSHTLCAGVKILDYLGNAERIAECAIELVKNGGCICVLMNTVKEAQEVYLEIKKRYQGDLMLFHARFPAQRRGEIEAECVRKYGKEKEHRPEQSILIATQVVEQSLDVDFDAMITAIAPIDLLLQRLGRVFRHDETKRPAALSKALLYVLTPSDDNQFGASAFVYPEPILKSSIRVLTGRNSIRIPEDLAGLVRDGYDTAKVPVTEIEEWFENKVKEQVEAGASQQYLINPPDHSYNILDDSILFEDEDGNLAVKTRLGEPTVRIAVVVPELFEQLKPYIHTIQGSQYAEVWKSDIADKIMRQSVSVRKSSLGNNSAESVHVFGGKLLSGTWIFCAKGQSCELANGKEIIMDPELGLRIEERKKQ